MTNGPGGVINNATLDGGNSSNHGFTVSGSLPGTSTQILSRTWGGPVEAAGAWLTGRVIGFIGMQFLLQRMFPALSFGWRRARAETMKRLLRPAMASLGFPFGNALNVQGIVIVIGVLFSPASVVVFGTLRTMTRFGTQIITAVCVNVAPEISIAYGAGNTARVQKLHDHACQVALWSAAAIAIGLLLFGKPILSLWTLDQVAMRWEIFVPLLAIMVINGVSMASMMLVYATNRHIRVAVVFVAVNTTVLGVAYVLGPWAGLTGIAAFLLVAESLLAGYVISQSLRLLGESPRQFLWAVLQSPLPLLWRLLRPK